MAVAVPDDRRLIETDSPEFSSAGFAFPNELASLVHVAHAAAELRGVSVREIVETTYINANKFFRAD